MITYPTRHQYTPTTVDFLAPVEIVLDITGRENWNLDGRMPCGVSPIF
jgi:hypothetical protein